MKNYLILIAFLYAQMGLATERIILVGGGTRPPEAMKRFVNWSGEEKSILIITWGSEEPEARFNWLREDLIPYTSNIIHAARPDTVENKQKFLQQLQSASGVFFSGGDQNRIMDILEDRELFDAIKNKFSSGTVFGGTSAGTAVAADIMFTGTADLTIIDGAKVETRKGLGFLPNLIIDQHYIVRHRHNRLFGLMLQHPDKVGLGIDEDTAVAITNQTCAEVLGATQVIKVTAESNRLVLDVYKDGDTFNLE
jgi:cyanophycinase